MACKFNSNMKLFTFTWIIDNFEYCQQKTGSFLKSPTFIVENMERTKWNLSIYPRGDESENWISLYLNREDNSKGPDRIEVDYEFAVLASDGSVLTSQSIKNRAFLKNDSDGYIDFVERESFYSKILTFLPQGALTIRCSLWSSNRELATDGQCIARTCIGVEQKVFPWKIQDFIFFSVGQEITYKLKSPSNDKVTMSLKLFLRKSHRCNCSYDIVIKFILADKSIVFSSFKSAIVDILGNYVECGKGEFWFSPTVQNNECILSLSLDTLMDNNDLYLPFNNLNLFCDLSMSTGTVLEKIEGSVYGCSPSFIMDNLEYLDTVNVKKANSDLKADLGSMLQDSTHCDVELLAGSETLPAHGFMLCARSEVFRAMLQNSSKKKTKNLIRITAKPDTVRRMLRYLYTNSLGELDWETAYDLCIVASEYQIKTLKKRCSTFFKSNLGLTNAYDTLKVAGILQDEELITTVQHAIQENYRIVDEESLVRCWNDLRI